MKRSAEKGQAFMELIVCLIPLVFVFAGLILVAVLGEANVSCTLQARSEADSGESSNRVNARAIRDWQYGKDGIPFTQDDQAVIGFDFADTASDLSTERNTVSGYFSRNLDMNDMAKEEQVTQMPGRVGFAEAASLSGAEVTMEDVLEKAELSTFSRMFQIYLKDGTAEIKDSAFMPDTLDEQYENFGPES